jgi:DNA primase
VDEDFKDKLRAANPIEELIGQHLELKRAGREFKACCPFHNEKTPSFFVIPDKQMYYCHGCHAHGDAFTFLMEYEGLGFIDAAKRLAERANLQLPDNDGGMSSKQAAERREKKRDLFTLHEGLAAWYQKMLRSEAGKHAMAYARNRGLDDDAMVAFGLGWAPGGWRATLEWGQKNGWTIPQLLEAGVLKVPDDNQQEDKAYDRFRDRLMFPIQDAQGRVIGFSGRAMAEDDKGPKYLNTPETPIFHKGSILYGIAQARQAMRTGGVAVLCEGQMDVIACHRAGIKHAVAPQGTAFTLDQARLIKRFADRIVIAFDSDKAGMRAAEKAREAFVPVGLTASVVLLGEGEDPDSLLQRAGAEALQARLGEARDYYDFLMDVAIAQEDASTPLGKDRAADRVLKAISELQSPILRSSYAERLADRLSIPKEAAFSMLKGMRAQDIRKARAEEARQQMHEEFGGGDFDMPIPVAPQVEEIVVEDPREAPLGVLLEIAAHHVWAAEELMVQLPPARAAGIAVGEALNLLLAHTQQDEWEEGVQMVFRPGETAPEILERWLRPYFNKDRAREEVNQALGDCLRRLRLLEIEAERTALNGKMAATADFAEKCECLK